MPPTDHPRRIGHRPGGPFATMAGLALVALSCAACERERRELRTAPAVAAGLDQLRLMPNGIAGAPPQVAFARDETYEGNAYNLSEGKRLYAWFGCATCHGESGQGGIGPSFVDGWWLYGPQMVSIVASLRDGRPHGMPSFKSRLTPEQMWQLAGYVRTIGAYRVEIGAPSRSDRPPTRPAENRGPAVLLFDEGPTLDRPDQGPRP